MIRLPYMPGLPMVARVPFTYNGVRYYQGDVFPNEVCDDRGRRKLHSARLIDCVPDLPAAQTLAPQPNQPEPQPRADKTDSTSYSAKHLGFGRWVVVDETDKQVSEGFMPKAAAETEAKRLNETRRGAGEGATGSGDVCPPGSAAPSINSEAAA